MPEYIVHEISRRRAEAIAEYERLIKIAPYLMSLQSQADFVNRWMDEHYWPMTWTTA